VRAGYGGNARAEGGVLSRRIALGYADMPGVWTVAVEDVVSRRRAQQQAQVVARPR
jgi:hypothetical protein